MADEGTDNSSGDAGDGGPPEMKPAGYFAGESLTRRKAFTVAGQAIGGAAGALIILPALGFALAPVFERAEETWQVVGSTDNFAADTYKAKVITIVAGIGEAGKSTVYVRQGSPELGERSDEYIAISTRCAHLGCPVRYFEATGNFICPCHGGVYGFEGEVLGGPPVRPLDRFQTRLTSAGEVEIGPRFSVTSSLEPVRARDPGEFTGGIWEYLYPPRPSTAPAP